MINKYMGKLSGPLLDRIDICTEVSPVKYKKLELVVEEPTIVKSVRNNIYKNLT